MEGDIECDWISFIKVLVVVQKLDTDALYFLFVG